MKRVELNGGGEHPAGEAAGRARWRDVNMCASPQED